MVRDQSQAFVLRLRWEPFGEKNRFQETRRLVRECLRSVSLNDWSVLFQRTGIHGLDAVVCV